MAEAQDLTEVINHSTPVTPLTPAGTANNNFTITKVQYDPKNLQLMQVYNNLLVMAIQEKTRSLVQVLDLTKPEEIQEYAIPPSSGSVHSVFIVDDRVLISTKNSDAYLIHRRKLRMLKWKLTVNCLLPEYRGKVLLTSEDKCYESDLETIKLIYTLDGVITGIIDDNDELVLSTKSRIYQFTPSPDSSLVEYFSRMKLPSYIELPESNNSKLVRFKTVDAFLCGAGVYYNIKNPQLIQMKLEDLLVTEHHFVILNENRLSIFCRLNGEFIGEYEFPSSVRLCQDSLVGTCWIYGQQDIFELTINHDIYKIFMELKQYESALEHATDEQKLDIYAKIGDEYFDNKRYLLASEYYCKSKDFNKLLKFLGEKDVQNNDLLLDGIVNFLVNTEGDEMQQCISNTLLIDILASWKPEKLKDYIGLPLHRKIFTEILQKYNINLIEYYEKTQDFEMVIDRNMEQKNYAKVFEYLPQIENKIPYLTKLYRVPGFIELLYRFELSPEQIIIVLSNFLDNPTEELIEYVQHQRSPQLNQLLLFLYLRSKSKKIFDIDINYLLTLKIDDARLKGVVYGELGLLQEAAELLLDVDMDLSEKYVNRMKGDEFKKFKKLLLQKRIEKEDPLQAVRNSLQDLTIEDVLPIVKSTEILVKDLKSELIEYLNDYKNKLDQIKLELQDIKKNTQELRQVPKPNKQFILTKCSSCNTALSSNAVVFPCDHQFHFECLKRELLEGKYLNTILLNRVKTADYQELIDIISQDCIYCGLPMIKTIDKPFI